MMKKFLWIFSLAGLLFACNNNEDPEPKPVDQDGITILAYLIGNVDKIESDIWTNIASMYDGLCEMNEKATLLIYWDGSGSYGEWNHPVVLRYVNDGKGKVNGLSPLDVNATVEEVVAIADVVIEYPSQISTNKDVMSKVLKDMISKTNTNNIGLITGSHGSAWVNSIFMNPSRAYGQDGKGTDNTILIKDMADAMKSTGKIFDFLLFDACYMATLEVCYDLRDATNYQLSSVLEIPAYGFPYHDIMKYLYEGTVEGYNKACQGYIDYYKEQSKYSNVWGTISLINSKEIIPLSNLIKNEIIKNKEVLKNYTPNHLQEYGRHNNANYISVDAKQFIKDINNGPLSSEFISQFNKTILYKGCLDEEESYDNSYYGYDFDIDKENYCGIGMYVPIKSYKNWNAYFKTLDWYTAAGWNEVDFSWNF